MKKPQETDEERKVREVIELLDYGPKPDYDYFTIDWPILTREWRFGTLTGELLSNLPPHLPPVKK